MTATAISQPPKQLGLMDAAMIIMGSMIGSGIFLAPALIAGIAVEGRLGAGSFVLIWIVGGMLTLCAALSFAELAASLPKTGGQYVYLSEAFSPFWGFLYGWTLFMVIQCGFIAAVAVAFANYLGVFLPWVSQSNALVSAGAIHVSTVQMVAIGLVAALTWINSRGLKEGAAVQNLLGVAKISALVGLVAFGLTSSRGDWSHFQPVLPATLTMGVLTAFAVGLSKALFAYDSWNVVTFVAEETREPARTLPRALFLGTLGVTVIYALTTSAYLYILPIDQAAGVADQRIAAEVAQIVLGPIGLTLIALAVLISTAGCDNGLVLSGPWLYYAMAKDGLFFSGAARLDPKRRMPVRSLQYQAIWSTALILSGSLGARGAQLYSDLLTFTAFASLLFNTLTVIGLFMLRKKRPELPRPYRVTAYPFVPLLFLVTAIFFLIFIALGDPRNSGFGLTIILAGVPLYLYLRSRRRRAAVPAAALAVVMLIPASNAFAQADIYHQRDFPAEEFQARWEKLFDRIGSDAFAIVQGYPKVNGFLFPRQTNEFYYLSGIETPESYLVLDGKTRGAILFLPRRDERLERSEGRILSAADVELAEKITGAAQVLSTDEISDTLRRLSTETGRVIYTPHAPAEGYAQSRGELASANASIASDAWDGRVSREAHFISLLRTRFPRAEIRDLSPMLDELRSIKSRREIALIRRASQLAGLGILEAMKTTRPGLYEYHLDAAARYVFLVNGARLDGYRSITAAGTDNINNMHYYRNDGQLQDGDMVLMDYAPDYRYYVSDVARMWPVSGRFLPWQRELLQFVLDYRNAVMTRIRPGVTADQIMNETRAAMEPLFARTRFSKPVYEQAARRLAATGGGVLSHPVGMAVHDVGTYRGDVLKPGQVFSVDPQMWVREENLYLRYEDVVVITEKGYENFTAFLPTELDDIEAMVRRDGIVQKFPPTPSP